MEELYSSLNNLLATLQVRRANLQSVHWNIKGCHSFITFHNYFGELYEITSTQIDMVAEFIRVHNGNPNGTLSKYLARTSVQEITPEQASDLDKALPKAIVDVKQLLILSNRLFTSTTDYPDVQDYAASLISELGKQKWFLSSSMKEELHKEDPSEEEGEPEY